MTPLTVLPIDIPEDNEVLAEKITLLTGQLNCGDYVLLKFLAAFDRRKAWNGGGTVRSCAHWLNWRCGITMGAARERVRVARALAQLPLIDAALATGQISYSMVRAMTRVATPENEGFLLNIAEYGTASHLEKVVSKYRRVQRPDDEAHENEQDNARKLVYYQDEDGMWVIHAKFPPEAGSLVVKAIEAVATPVQLEQQEQLKKERPDREEDPEAVENISAETFFEDVEKAEHYRFQDLVEHTRADALASIAEHFLATADQNERFRGLKGSERCQVVLHVDINTLRDRGRAPSLANEHCQLDDKHWLYPNTAKRLACDASLLTVLEDEQGRVLNIGRRSRTVPAPISRALNLRDKTCRFPGCCEARYVDAHHIQHWADGGETSLDNLVTLCRHHHRQLHRGGFSVEVEQSGVGPRLLFTTPSGSRIETSFFPLFENVSTEMSQQALRTMAPEVDAQTCVSKWCGEDCDYGMAIDALLERDKV